jgi:hypothetical protein
MYLSIQYCEAEDQEQEIAAPVAVLVVDLYLRKIKLTEVLWIW